MGNTNGKYKVACWEDMKCSYCSTKLGIDKPLVRVYSYCKLNRLVLCGECLWSKKHRYNLNPLYINN
jgi:hypothetical protein